ncbi:MAG: ATP-binding cassette domain-containing protein [Desulfurococcaceae archaeon]|jgi:simple sugar transport system ATP-binding protein|nr:ATP-binding cassette domain-containing protein [Desulfurococcaceae archaeon]
MSTQTFFSLNGEKSLNPIISARGLWKSFPGVVALKDVSLDVLPGEIHAILGENGAGKSTLLKILYGIYVPDKGDLFFGGRKVVVTSPQDAVRNGLVLVSQVPQLIDSLTVAENLSLSLSQFGYVSSVRKVSKFLLEKGREYGVRVDPDIEVWKLSYTQKQLVEVLRALLLNAKVIAFDEATTLLPHAEKEKLYDFMKLFKSKGGSVLLVTHKIPEAMEVSDRITVLRRGEVVGTVRTSETTLDQVRYMMFGERLTQLNSGKYEKLGEKGSEVLVVRDLWVRSDYGVYAVKGVSFSVRKGEILGIAGVAGNGQLELIQALAGLRKSERGSIRLRINGNEIDVTNKGSTAIRRLGIGYIPDEPVKKGVSLDNSIEENIAVHPRLTRFLIRWGDVKSLATDLVREFSIVTPSTNAKAKVLSGGNLMKVLVARELTVSKVALVAYNPTRGLDEVSTRYVRRLIVSKAVSEGMCVVVASEDLDEIMEISDVIAVMNSGSFVGVFKSGVSREEVERVMVS